MNFVLYEEKIIVKRKIFVIFFLTSQIQFDSLTTLTVPLYMEGKKLRAGMRVLLVLVDY